METDASGVVQMRTVVAAMLHSRQRHCISVTHS